MTDIKILPIFDQAAPGVWHDFIDVYAETMYASYNSTKSFDDKAELLHKYVTKWKKRRTKIAFGAYDGARMVGFIQGYVLSRRAWVDSLYLIREYHGNGIGKALLREAEEAMAPIATIVELISLADAMNFYESQGYRSYSAKNYYRKTLNTPFGYAFTPIFGVNSALAEQCVKINPDFNAATINVQHQPMFVHFDKMARVDAYIGAGALVPQMRVERNSDHVRKILQFRMDAYMRMRNR